MADVVHDDPEAGGEDEELALAHLDALVADDGELDVVRLTTRSCSGGGVHEVCMEA